MQEPLNDYLKTYETLIIQAQQVHCKKHMKEIKFIDIGHEITLGNRAICEDCSLQGKIIKIEEAFQMVKSQENDEIISKIRNFIQQKEVAHQSIIVLLNQFQNHIEVLVKRLINKFNSFFNKLYYNLDPLQNFQQDQLNLSKICYIGELISQNSDNNRIENIENFFKSQINQQRLKLKQELEEAKQKLVDTIQTIDQFENIGDKQEQIKQFDDQELESNHPNIIVKQKNNLKFHYSEILAKDNKILFAGFSSDNKSLFLVRQNSVISIIDVKSNQEQEQINCVELKQLTFFHACPVQNTFIAGDSTKILIYSMSQDNSYQKRDLLPLTDCQHCFLDYQYEQGAISKLFALQNDEINIYVKALNQIPCIWKKRNSIKNVEHSLNICFNRNGILAFGDKQFQIYWEKKQDTWEQIEIKQTTLNNCLRILAICQKDVQKKQSQNYQKCIYPDGIQHNSKFRSSLPPLERNQQIILEDKCSNILYITLNVGNLITFFIWEFFKENFQVSKIFKYSHIPRKLATGEDKILIFNQSKELTSIEYEKEILIQRSMIFCEKTDFFCMPNKSGSNLVQIYQNSYKFISIANVVFDVPQNLKQIELSNINL